VQKPPLQLPVVVVYIICVLAVAAAAILIQDDELSNDGSPINTAGTIHPTFVTYYLLFLVVSLTVGHSLNINACVEVWSSFTIVGHWTTTRIISIIAAPNLVIASIAKNLSSPGSIGGRKSPNSPSSSSPPPRR